MDVPRLAAELEVASQEILGYLNFSSGAADPRFLHNLDLLWRHFEPTATIDRPTWRLVAEALVARLETVRGSSQAFAQVDQAQTILALVFERALPAYRNFHRDLLFHQSDEALFRPYFVGRVCEAVLRASTTEQDSEEIIEAALDQLNDFVGHRPVAVLRTPQKVEPYEHEWVRPVPWFVAGAGFATGRYQDLFQQALAILQNTDEEILQQAGFDLAALDELAIDPRAYDFEHPANKRPNYHFGQWDPHNIDNRGRYRRFVLVQVTLDALLERLDTCSKFPPNELLFEAAAALAGTILMASGISGGAPQAHDSSVTLATLLPKVARYRDQFYERLIAKVPGPHGERLKAEAVTLKQPFGGVRQHLNQRLARRRADQLQRVHLAQIYARMGYPDAALRQARIVPVASARMLCELQCRLALGRLAIDRQELDRAADYLPEIEDLLIRGIECGALGDPWNILGFQGQFSVFQALENSVHDHRVDDLLRLMRQIFGLYARTLSEAAAAGRNDLERMLAEGLRRRAEWWDQFASTEVASVEGVSGRAALDSALHVAAALAAWHRGGAAAGDVAFWREHVAGLDSPKAYALVVDALLEKGDLVASMALLLHWVSRGDEVSIESGDYAFHTLAIRWMRLVQTQNGEQPAAAWKLIRRFFDHLEVNADEYWNVPDYDRDGLGLASSKTTDRGRRPPSESGPPKQNAGTDSADDDAWPDDEVSDEESSDDGDNLYRAAYEDMQFRDSAADGHEGEMLESSGPAPTQYEADFALQRFEPRLAFLTTLARLWKLAAAGPVLKNLDTPSDDPISPTDTLAGWLERAQENQARLADLLAAVHRQTIPAPTGSRESLLEYDRRRMTQQSLEERVINTSVEMGDASRFLRAAANICPTTDDLPAWEAATVPLLRGVLEGNAGEVSAQFDRWLAVVKAEPLLYIPLASKGSPQPIVAAQSLQRTLGDLLTALPRLGLFLESCRLLETAQDMETEHPVGKGAVTEFDRLFRLGFRAQVESLVKISAGWRQDASANRGDDERTADAELIECLEPLTESVLRRWLMHSRSLRLSVLEKVTDAANWKSLVAFIEKYGADLFTQSLFHVANLRAILHRGVENWLEALEADRPSQGDFALLDDLDRGIPRAEAAAKLELIFEAVLENFAEYRDYNNIATQSDRGELLHMFLDLLRLKARYERVAWNLRPVFLAHEILVRNGRLEAAELWRQGFSRKTADAAQWHLKRLDELTERYGLHLPTVADRLAEKFVRPLALDRIRALVRPAIDEVRRGEPAITMPVLEQEIQDFAETPIGAGFDVPAWLLALEYEVDQAALTPAHGGAEQGFLLLPQKQLSAEEFQQQLNAWKPAGDL